MGTMPIIKASIAVIYVCAFTSRLPRFSKMGGKYDFQAI